MTRPSQQAWVRAWQKTAAGRAYHRAYMARHRAQDPDFPRKMKARNLLNRAVKRGEIERPATCSRCGNAGRIEAHHSDYDKPLDVTWLCTSCHRRIDSK